MDDTENEIIEALIFKIKKMDKVVAAAAQMIARGSSGRGQVIDGAQTVEVLHRYWLDMVEAMDAFK